MTTIFRKMADIYNCQVGFWQRQFLLGLFKAVFSLRGRAGFTNLARFSLLHEQTFRRHFQKAFRWVWFNLIAFRLRHHPEEPVVGVFDCSFLPKSGTETWGLDQFFSSLAGQSKKELEVSILGIVATGSRRAFGIGATQTPLICRQIRPADIPAWTSTLSKLSIPAASLLVWWCPTGSLAASAQNGRSSTP